MMYITNVRERRRGKEMRKQFKKNEEKYTKLVITTIK